MIDLGRPPFSLSEISIPDLPDIPLNAPGVDYSQNKSADDPKVLPKVVLIAVLSDSVQVTSRIRTSQGHRIRGVFLWGDSAGADPPGTSDLFFQEKHS